MCWRTEGKTTGYRAALLGAAFLLSTAGGEGLGAQELPQEIVRLIETQAENGGGDTDGMVEYFTELLDRPIDLSMADMATLEACPLFTPFMAVSLLEYRREYGPVSSAAELALVDGFSPAVVELLQPFVTFGRVGSGGGQSRERKWYEKFSGKWTVRSKMDLERGGGFPDEGFPVPLYSRLRVDFGDRCSAGLTLENDRGERDFPDFCSFFISVQDLPLTRDGRFRLEAAVAGDFSLRFGQGLVLWNSFSMSGLSSPSAAVRRDGAVRPYTSSDENNYFHGAAMTFGFPGGVRASVFYSNNGADAAVEGGYFISLPDDGLHDTDARRQGRNALREEVAGGNVSWRNSWIKAGVTAAAYRYDRLDGRRTSYYNEHLRYDGWWSNASVDFLLSLKGVRVFGEAAADFGGAFAVIGGAVWPLSASVEASLVYRYYSPRYIATHAGAYSRSNVNNEHGASTALRWSCGSGVTVSASAEYTHFPWARFGVREPSDCLKAYVGCQWEAGENHLVYGKLSGTWDNGRDTRLLRLRGEYTYVFGNGIELSPRGEGSWGGGDAFGVLLFQELNYRAPSGRIRCSVRATAFSAEDWDARIYCYERDVPGAFSVPAYYGKGAGLYATVTYKPVRWFNLSLKCSALKRFDAPDKDELGVRLQLTLPF